ncbi:hypothetical protein JD844_015179 [Phrynosoma platyrhinos]|uniref:Ig-like domain-containing protein n=1 Tax=Phrynosoma platyrhinos TaxID=52577 RepID=A0ABQ7T7S4_PHRPL|nr:hypothetical protein JD844_015179 [Phrynosoma platyrhinos]
MNSGYSISKERARWFQQKSSGVPRFLYHYYTSGDQGRGSGVPERFSVSPDASNNLWNLVIAGVQAEDEAVYYWISSQSTPTQPISQPVSLGETVKLSCTFSDSSSYKIGWSQQRSGVAPRFVQYTGSSRGEGIPDRFTASQSGDLGYLTITNTQTEDEADYYCGRCLFRGNTDAEVLWLQQESGQVPRFVHCNGCSNRGEGIPSRFTASATDNIAYLTITDAQVEDEAEYDCLCWSSSESMFHRGVASQPTLTQTPSQSVTLGNTVKLTTTLSSGYDSYVVSWYQQREGQAPRLVLDTSNNRGSGIPDRFSGSKAGRERYLTITNVQAEDEATYYCAAAHGSGKLSVQQLQSLKETESVAAGGTVSLSCRYNSGNIGDSNYPLWVQQKFPQKPGTVMYGTSTRPSDVPARFSGSRSGDLMSLTIAGAMEEDEAIYYCSAWTGSGRHIG